MGRAAPGDLETLRAFVNTYDSDSGGEQVGTPEALAAWLVEHSLLGEGEAVNAAGQVRALRLREALRRLGRANHDGVPDPAAAAEIDALAADCRLVVRWEENGVPSLAAVSGGVDGALGSLLAILYAATVDGTWARFKVCGNDSCRWAFYDGSKNRSGRFCGTACGNAVHARAYRRRKAAETPAAD
jgi:predicted RNA-binding Zn ribbon-like protein